MNDIFAIDPAAPRDIRELKVLLERFGMGNGRFIARYPDDWREMLLEHFDGLSDLDRSRMSRLLQIHGDAFLEVALSYSRAASWPMNAARTLSRGGGVRRVLARKPNEEGLPTLESYLWESDEDPGAEREAHIPRTPQSYAAACRPLLALSSEIHMVDRFFQLRRPTGDVDRRRRAVLCELVRAAVQLQRCESFIVYFECPGHLSEAEFEAIVADDLGEIQTVCRCDETGLVLGFDIRDDFDHGRYIFSVKGGLQFDYGFDTGSAGSNHVRWVSKVGLQPLFRKYGVAFG